MSIPMLSQIDEWGPSNFQNDKIHLSFIVGVIALLIIFGIRLSGARLLAFLLTLVFALEHKRGLGVFSLVAPIFIVRPLEAAVPWLRRTDASADPVAKFCVRKMGPILAVSALLICSSELLMSALALPIRPASRIAPVEALAVAKNEHLKGNVLNSYAFGGFLLFNGIPPFIDGRASLYGNRFLEEYIRAFSTPDPSVVSAFLAPYDVSWALLTPKETIAFVLKSQGWKQLYADETATLLVRP